MGDAADSARVKVVARVRPTLAREVRDGKVVCCVAADEKRSRIYLAGKGGGDVVVDDAGTGGGGDVPEFRFDKVLRGDCTEDEVYDGLIRDTTRTVLDGYNTTVFAYGQSGSGKTHTITHLTSRILDDVLRGLGVEEEDDESDSDGSSTDSAAESVLSRHEPCHLALFQIYREGLTDLLQSTTPKLRLKPRSDGSMYVEKGVHVPFRSAKQALELIRQGTARRAVGATDLNEVSSRSHLILQFTINGAKLNLIDLAGSERLKQSNATGSRLEEAKFINSTLFTLVKVVRTLADAGSGKKAASVHVPYRDSLLTYFLKDSLGGTSNTLLVATLSPAAEAADETRCTLKFATACGSIVNKPTKGARPPQKPKAGGGRKKATAPRVAPWAATPPVQTVRALLPTKLGDISVLRPQATRSPTAEVVYVLHGCPSEAANCTKWFNLLLYCGLWPVAVDQPGWGGSPGQQHRSRSEYNTAEGGPVDVCLAVMRAMDVASAHFMGYDWGAGILLSLGLKHPLRVKSLMSIMPSYGEASKGELAKLKPPTLVLWVESDQFHSWRKWRPLAASIPKGTVRTQRSTDKDPVDAFGVDVCRFVTGADPFCDETALGEGVKVAGKTTAGEAVTMVNQVTLKSELTEAELGQALTAGRVGAKGVSGAQAVSACLKLLREAGGAGAAEVFKQCATGGHGDAQCRDALQAFAAVPELSPKAVDDGASLAHLGVWSAVPAGRSVLDASPRYFAGRRVLVRVKGVDACFKSPAYMSLLKAEVKADDLRAEEFVTHKGVLVGMSPSGHTYDVEIPCEGGGVRVVAVDRHSVHELNQPHLFSSVVSGSGKVFHLFEDGIKGSYASALVKGKVLEIACRLAAPVARLDFAAKDCAAVQMECVRVIRACLNATTFAEGLDRTRVGRTDDVGRLAGYGQVQCHGGSSLTAFFLAPFADALGLDVKYRGGYTFGPGHNPSRACVSNDVEAHQWLEVTLLPSCTTVVVDFFLNLICQPIDDAYAGMMYPNGKLICQTSSQAVRPATDIAF